MAQNNHRNLTGFICGFILGKLSIVLKLYSGKRKKKEHTPKFKMLSLLVFPLGLLHQSRTAGERNPVRIILPNPLCNLGIICVTPHGNLSISEHL